MVFSRAYSKVIPIKASETLNVNPESSDIQIIQLDRTWLKLIWEIKDVLIIIYPNPKIHQTIDIIMVYIPDNYGMILSRYWSTMLNGYISINW